MAATALIPGAATAQRGDDNRGDRGFNRNPNGVTIESRLAVGQDRPQPQPRADRGDDGPRPDRGDRGPRGGERGNSGQWRGGVEGRGQASVQPVPQASAPVAQPDRGDRGGWRGNDRRDGNDVRVNRGGNRDWRNDDRGNTARWRGNDGRGDARGDDRGGNTGQWRGNDRRPDVRYDQGRGNQGNWNRGWRQDNRYDWNRRRQYNRNAFHLPRYYAPSGWGYGYRRFTIGITLNAGLFGRNYWLDDADYYGLPEAYGPYRWIRYYNDALLVDVYSGRVVDTVYDIFW